MTRLPAEGGRQIAKPAACASGGRLR